MKVYNVIFRSSNLRIGNPFLKGHISYVYVLFTANPKDLINTVYLNNPMYFDTRSNNDHVHKILNWETLTLTGDKFLKLSERATQTRTEVTKDNKAFAPKMFEGKGKQY